MNGRVYDYNVGRFLSVDPVIVDPTNTQAINPYSYVMNNPLSYTDPSGYSPKSGNEEFEKKIRVRVKTAGSRITRVETVTVTASGNADGSTRVSVSGSSNGAISKVAGAIAGKVSAAGGTISDIGGSGSIAQAGAGSNAAGSTALSGSSVGQGGTSGNDTGVRVPIVSESAIDRLNSQNINDVLSGRTDREELDERTQELMDNADLPLIAAPIPIAASPKVLSFLAKFRAPKGGVNLLRKASDAAFKAADNISGFIPKNKHILGGGSQSKARFNTADVGEIRRLIQEGLRSPNARFLPNPNVPNTFRVVTDLGRQIGIKGQTRLRTIVGLDGKVINSFPVRTK